MGGKGMKCEGRHGYTVELLSCVLCLSYVTFSMVAARTSNKAAAQKTDATGKVTLLMVVASPQSYSFIQHEPVQLSVLSTPAPCAHLKASVNLPGSGSLHS